LKLVRDKSQQTYLLILPQNIRDKTGCILIIFDISDYLFIMSKKISESAINRREYWVGEIRNLSGNFGSDADRLEAELTAEIKKEGIIGLIDHLHLCGNIPESYGHDTSEEKLYSKYTDCLLSLTYKSIGLQSIVLKERADSADVEVFGNDLAFVADAKAFRLSRTAKNQKDFKVQAMHNWKRDKPYAMVVCPIYHLPASSSQIYQQATSQNVCLFTYSHLALILAYSQIDRQNNSQLLLKHIFETVRSLNPSKNAVDYWKAINTTILSFSEQIPALWDYEKAIVPEIIRTGKNEALTFLAQERQRIMQMSHNEALSELVNAHKIENRIATINSISDNGLLALN
jgi:hypothetical protein